MDRIEGSALQTFSKLSLLVRLGWDSNREFIRKLGLSRSEYEIASFLLYHSGCSQDAVARNLGLDKTTVAKSLDTLCEAGIAGRDPDPDNRRRNKVGLTSRGRSLVEDSVHDHERWFETIAGTLDEGRLAAFERGVDFLLGAALATKVRPERSMPTRDTINTRSET